MKNPRIRVLIGDDSFDNATPAEVRDFAAFVREYLEGRYPYANISVRVGSALRTTVDAEGTHDDAAHIADLIGGPIYSDWLGTK